MQFMVNLTKKRISKRDFLTRFDHTKQSEKIISLYPGETELFIVKTADKIEMKVVFALKSDF